MIVPAETGDPVWSSAAWYRALTLVERAEQRAGDPMHWTDSRDPARGVRRFETWTAQEPFTRVGMLEQRLAADSLTEADFLAILSELEPSRRNGMPGPPEWLAAIEEAYSLPLSDSMRSLLTAAAIDHPLAPCLSALAPLLQHGLAAVQSQVERLRARYPSLPLDPNVIGTEFLTNLAPDLLYRLSKPLILDLNIARLQGQLQGATPEERFGNYLGYLDDDRGILALLMKYPVLARQIVTAIDLWAGYLAEVLTHLSADWTDIRTTFFAEPDPGPVTTIQPGLGDRHRGGRSVLLLGFASGARLLYKPKSLAVDAHFQDLLRWLNERGADPGFRTVQLLDRGTYGWSEFVAAEACSTPVEVERFYRRQGAFLALLYALGGVDLHNENVIAAGEHPVFIDLEALFHPHVHSEDAILTEDMAARAMDRSVWQVGLLPRRVWAGKESTGVDTSGLGGEGGQTLPHPLVRWQQAGSDEMRIARAYIGMPAGENRPRLGQEPVNVLAYQQDIVDGFTTMYRLLCQVREELLREQLPRFADDEIRVVGRSTSVDGTLLYESFHPDLLRDALDRDRFFDRLWIEAVDRPYLARIAAAERRDLWRGDIPLFTTTPASRAIVTADGQTIPDFLAVPSLDLVRERILGLNEADLARQTWIVEASLATLLMDREDAMGTPVSFTPSLESIEASRLADLADQVGRRLGELAIQEGGKAHWLTIGPLDAYTWGLFPAGIDLYGGTSGIVLFLAYLGAIGGDPAYTDLARRGLSALCAQIERVKRHPGDIQIGAFDGLGSPIYVLTHLAALWDDASLLNAAHEMVELLASRIEKDGRLDIVYGSAGCILSLLALHAVHPRPHTLEIATDCGDHLLSRAQGMPEGLGWVTLPDQPPLGGFSHGSAGIAFSLLKLAAATGQDRFRSAALAALAFDRSLYLPSLANWEDRRVFPAREGGNRGDGDGDAHKSMVAWCHGAPGIGLARLEALPLMDDELVRREVDAALGTTMRHGFVSNHSLCHGALGNTDFVLSAAERLGRGEDHAMLAEATARVVGSIERNGVITGVPLGVEAPGLMTGLAGVGWELLRLMYPARVPSLLTLAPPTGFAAR